MRFLIIDDHPLLRMGARQMLESRWVGSQVDEAETLAEGLRLFRAARPDVVLLDLRLPDADGIESAVRMTRVAAGVPILVVSQNDEAAHAARLLELGVRGFLPKDRAATDLPTAVQRLLDGGRYLTPEQADRMVDLLAQRTHEQRPVHEALSTQEFRVTQLIAAGHTPAQIAEAMHLSVKTVGSYRARIFDKTGWRSNAELVKYCLQHGLTEPAKDG
ncbi:MAG: response regulator transcription factor [Aquincola sp.]|nr:response regulator transcription factor [Aquincola sp.]|tara:strand:+ start:1664 stop:2314 length:651 start_codon:yes stop_codon:yes gene_type:complete